MIIINLKNIKFYLYCFSSAPTNFTNINLELCHIGNININSSIYKSATVKADSECMHVYFYEISLYLWEQTQFNYPSLHIYPNFFFIDL